MTESTPQAFGVDDIAGLLLALRQIAFLVWVDSNEQEWAILGERRSCVALCQTGKPNWRWPGTGPSFR